MYFSAKLESSFYFSATWNVNCALINCYGDLILIGQYRTPPCIFYSTGAENEIHMGRRGTGQ